MIEEWQRVLGPDPVPVRMRRPLDVELLPVVEWRGDVFANQLVEYHAVVDAFDLGLSTEQLPALELQLARIDGIDPEQQLRRREVGIRLLLPRVDVHEDDFGGIVIAGDRPPRE